jgi:hypothetical protein
LRGGVEHDLANHRWISKLACEVLGYFVTITQMP